jgi:hypothetical protein
MSQSVSKWDMCCKWREPIEFDDDNNPSSLTEEQVYVLLTLNRMGFTTGLVIQILLFLLWSLCVIIPGFALYDGNTGTVSAYTHLGWWQIIEAVVLFIAVRVTLFGLSYSPREGIIEKGVARTRDWITFYKVALVFSSVSHLTHLILTLLEKTAGQCSGTFCKYYEWAFWIFFVYLAVSIVLNGWMFFRIMTFSNNLALALAYNKVDMTMSNTVTDKNTASPPYSGPTPTAPSSNTGSQMLKTSLLRAAAVHGYKGKGE